MKTIINTLDAPKADRSLFAGVRYGDMLFVSGMLGMDPETGEFAGRGHRITGRQGPGKSQAVIEAAGMGCDNVLKVDGVPERHE